MNIQPRSCGAYYFVIHKNRLGGLYMSREQLLRILAIIDEAAHSPYPLADAEVAYFKRLSAAAEEYLAAMNAARTNS